MTNNNRPEETSEGNANPLCVSRLSRHRRIYIVEIRLPTASGPPSSRLLCRAAVLAPTLRGVWSDPPSSILIGEASSTRITRSPSCFAPLVCSVGHRVCSSRCCAAAAAATQPLISQLPSERRARTFIAAGRRRRYDTTCRAIDTQFRARESRRENSRSSRWTRARQRDCTFGSVIIHGARRANQMNRDCGHMEQVHIAEKYSIPSKANVHPREIVIHVGGSDRQSFPPEISLFLSLRVV